jgi:hypothetical protein
VGNKFTLVLNREITEDETGVLRESGCADASVTSVTVPGTDDTVVTQMEFDTDAGPSLSEAIEAALEAVKTVPDLSVPTLTVPAQPAQPTENGAAAEPTVLEGAVLEEGAGEPGSDEPTAISEPEAAAAEASEGGAEAEAPSAEPAAAGTSAD